MIRRLLVACVVAFLLAGPLAVVHAQQGPATTSRNLAASGGAVTLIVSSYGSVAFQVSGTWAGTITFEGSIDGNNYANLVSTPTSGTSAVSTTTANGVWTANAGGLQIVRARMSSYTSGTAVVTIQTAVSGGGSGGGGAAGTAITIWDAVDTAQVSTTAGGSLQVECTSGCGGSGGTSAADGAAYVAGTTSGTPIVGARDDTSPGTVAEDKLGIVRITTNRAQHVNLRDASGAESGVAAVPLQVSLANHGANATAVKVDGSAVTQPVSGTVTVNGTITANAGSGTLAVSNAGTFAAQAAQSGTWTVQPGNTANTTAWKVDGSAVTQPVSVSTIPSHPVTNAGTFLVQENGAALTALQLIDNLPNTIGSTTSGQSGALILGAVTTGAPTYTTAQSSPLSLDTTGALRVTGASGTTQYAEDAAHVSGDAMVIPGAVRRDTTPSSSSGSAGDYSTLNVDANGRLYTNTTLYDATGTAITSSSDYTHDAALTVASTAGPATVFRATSAVNAAVSADDDAVLGIATLSGKQIVLPYSTPAQTWSYAAAAGGIVASGSPATAHASCGASTRNYITSIQVINSHATISTEFLIRDGASGTVLHRGWAQAAGGGYAVHFEPALRGATATLVEIAEVTTTASTGILANVQGFCSAE